MLTLFSIAGIIIGLSNLELPDSNLAARIIPRILRLVSRMEGYVYEIRLNAQRLVASRWNSRDGESIALLDELPEHARGVIIQPRCPIDSQPLERRVDLD